MTNLVQMLKPLNVTPEMVRPVSGNGYAVDGEWKWDELEAGLKKCGFKDKGLNTFVNRAGWTVHMHGIDSSHGQWTTAYFEVYSP